MRGAREELVPISAPIQAFRPRLYLTLLCLSRRADCDVRGAGVTASVHQGLVGNDLDAVRLALERATGRCCGLHSPRCSPRPRPAALRSLAGGGRNGGISPNDPTVSKGSAMFVAFTLNHPRRSGAAAQSVNSLFGARCSRRTHSGHRYGSRASKTWRRAVGEADDLGRVGKRLVMSRRVIGLDRAPPPWHAPLCNWRLHVLG
jgi:hypothetical protein